MTRLTHKRMYTVDLCTIISIFVILWFRWWTRTTCECGGKIQWQETWWRWAYSCTRWTTDPTSWTSRASTVSDGQISLHNISPASFSRWIWTAEVIPCVWDRAPQWTILSGHVMQIWIYVTPLCSCFHLLHWWCTVMTLAVANICLPLLAIRRITH